MKPVEIDLTPEDEEILDEIWDEIGQSEDKEEEPSE